MGSAVSARVRFEDRGAYETWELSAILEMIEEQERLGLPCATHQIDRQEFFSLFYSHKVMGVGGEWCLLPVEHFGMFLAAEKDSAVKATQLIAIRRPLALLVLLSQPDYDGTESFGERLGVLARVFASSRDACGEPQFVRGDIQRLWLELVHVMIVANMLPPDTDLASVEALVKSSWSKMMGRKSIDEGLDESVLSMEQLRAWCASDLGQKGLLSRALHGDFKASLQLASGKSKNGRARGAPAAKLEMSRADARYQRAQSRSSLGAMREQRKQEKLAGLKKIEEQAMESTKTGEQNRGMVTQGIREMQRERKRKVNVIATTKSLTGTMVRLGVEFDFIMALREDFADLTVRNEADLHSTARHSLTRKQLQTLLVARHPTLEEGHALKRLLDCFDVDGDGHIDFDEFCVAMARMREDQPVSDKLKFIFDLFDESHNGQLELWELTDVIEDHTGDITQMYEYCHQIVQSLDMNGDGEITLSEFQQSLEREKVFVNFAWAGISPVHPDVENHVRTLRDLKIAQLAAEELDDTPRDAEAARVAPLHAPIDPDVSESALEGVLSDAATSALFAQHAEIFIAMIKNDTQSFDEFWSVASRAWGLPEAQGPAAEEAARAIFELCRAEDHMNLDATADSRRLWTAISHGLATLTVSKDQILSMKTAILFRLIDDGADEKPISVTTGEVSSFLLTEKENLVNSMDGVLSMFDELDADGDGSISIAELTAFVEKNPRMMQLLKCLFFL